MDWQTAVADMEYRCTLAREFAPRDPFTILARLLMAGISLLLTPFVLVAEFLTTLIGGCLLGLTFGLLAVLLTIIWLPFLGLLVGTSWLWLRAWYLRPLLLLPGVLLAIIADTYVALAPEPERDAKHAKLSIASEWPLSWYLLRPPPAYGMVRCDVCTGTGIYRDGVSVCFACKGYRWITPELSRRLNEHLAVESRRRGVDKLADEKRWDEHLSAIQEIVDELQYGQRKLASPDRGGMA